MYYRAFLYQYYVMLIYTCTIKLFCKSRIIFFSAFSMLLCSAADWQVTTASLFIVKLSMYIWVDSNGIAGMAWDSDKT